MKRAATVFVALYTSMISANLGMADVNRQVERINVRAYRNVMRTNYPSPLAQHFRLMHGDFRQFVNTNVLTKDNADLLRDSIIKALKAEANAQDSMAKAQRAAIVDPDLRSTRARTEDSLKTLGLVAPQPIGSEVQKTPTPPTDKDYTHFNEPVD